MSAATYRQDHPRRGVVCFSRTLESRLAHPNRRFIMSRVSATASVVAVLAALASIPAQAVQRAFVASYGNDANTATNCGFTNPCRGFTAAQTVTDPNGEIVALDAAGYGAVTIVKSITITANPGFYAGIAASTGNAVTIATAGVNVILRGLNINGVGATDGIRMTNGTSLSVENCVVSNFTNNGIWVTTAARVRVSDSLVRGNTLDGIALEAGATGSVVRTKANAQGRSGIISQGTVAAVTTTVSVSDSDASGNAYGLVAYSTVATAIGRISASHVSATNNSFAGVSTQGTADTAVSIGSSLVTGNSQGLANSGGGTFESLGNNLVRQNGSNTSGTITTVSGI
ncbi:MAG: right-handed parallel beta-helix repeat-containing protein [Usitatibacter sp.]